MVFSKDQSHFCETKTVLVSLSTILSVPFSFRKFHVHSEKKVAHHSEITGQIPLEKNQKDCILNGTFYRLPDQKFLISFAVIVLGGIEAQVLKSK